LDSSEDDLDSRQRLESDSNHSRLTQAYNKWNCLDMHLYRLDTQRPLVSLAWALLEFFLEKELKHGHDCNDHLLYRMYSHVDSNAHGHRNTQRLGLGSNHNLQNQADNMLNHQDKKRHHPGIRHHWLLLSPC